VSGARHAPAPDAEAMDDRQLLRYSRHLLLDDLGVEGQEKLLAAHALILGAGGLGSPVALYLASAGVGRLTIVDDDAVDLTNLQRQIMHTEARIGQAKVDSARQAIAALNPGVQVRTLARRADEALLQGLVADADVVLDCSDNFRHPARPERRLRAPAPAAGVWRRHRLRRPGVGV
jgi:molybdopterin/thiamine biosynthesis adenylyltransferase